jgi:ABC-type transporter Mla subunit MlaD
MSKQARVGLFTLLGIIGLIWVYYELSNIAERRAGYRIAVHFTTAAGLRPAALVYLSGVSIGIVDAINLRKDFSTDVVIAVRKNVDIPVGSKFIINAPLTGEPNLDILPPRPLPGQPPPATLSRDIALESADMPQGTNPATLTDLLEEGQGEIRRTSRMLRQLEEVEPELLAQLEETLRTANALTKNANTSLTSLTGQASDITASLQRSLDSAGNNIVDLTSTLNGTATGSSRQLNTLLATLNASATSLSASMDSLHKLAANPQVSSNLIATTQSIAVTTKTLADLTNDLRQVTGNPQTQAQLRDTVGQFDAASQKANYLLAQLGGKSSVPGVDPGATPFPSSPPGGIPQSSSGTSGSGSTSNSAATANVLSTAFKSKLSNVIGNVASVQLRLSMLSVQRTGTPGAKSPLLTADQGPETDANLVLFPNGKTALYAGANNIGTGETTSWNLAALERLSANAHVGAGIIYSQLGVLGSVRNNSVGIEGRLYDPRHPTLDSYLNLYLAKRLQIFGGERDILYPDRRTVFGLQSQF